MAEKRGMTGRLEYDFVEDATLEVFSMRSNQWIRVTPVVFRSWDGKRRITSVVSDPNYFEGSVYLYETNRRVVPRQNNCIVNDASEYDFIKC